MGQHVVRAFVDEDSVLAVLGPRSRYDSRPPKVRFFVVATLPSYEAAIAEYNRLYDLHWPIKGDRRQGRGRPVMRVQKHDRCFRDCNGRDHQWAPVNVTLFDVRSADDPVVKGNLWRDIEPAREAELAFLAPGKGSQYSDAQVRRWGERHGYHSHTGGWLYAGSPDKCKGLDDRPLTQGWASIENRLPKGTLVWTTDFRWHLTIGWEG